MQIANLKFANAESTLVDLDVTLDEETANQYHAAGSTIPFTWSLDATGPIAEAVTALIGTGGYTIAPYVAPPPEVPRSITPRQCRLALNHAGLRSYVEAYVAGASQDVKDTWEFSTMIERDNAIITQAAEALALTSQQIDDLFILAATL